MKKYDWNVEKLQEVVKDCVNLGEVLDALGVPRLGNNTKTLRGILDREGIDYSHFTGRAREYAKPGVKNVNYYLTNQGFIRTSKLKEKLFREGLKENKCECCGITEWNGKPLIMQLHHIDGNNKNNSLENLQILCPNCHSQTDNYCGSANVTEETNKKYYCADCGKEINKGSKYCSMCGHKHRENNLSKCPPLEQFVKDFLELKGFLQVGKKYNVSDNSVKKWAEKFNLPYHTKELLDYLNNHTLEEIIERTKIERIAKENSGQFKMKYDHELILKLIDLKYNSKEISEYVGCSTDTVKAVASKYKHPLRKANIRCISFSKNDNIVKYCFGGVEGANWLYQQGFTQYKIGTLEDKMAQFAKTNMSVFGYRVEYTNLPSIKYILENNKEEELLQLVS